MLSKLEMVQVVYEASRTYDRLTTSQGVSMPSWNTSLEDHRAPFHRFVDYQIDTFTEGETPRDMYDSYATYANLPNWEDLDERSQTKILAIYALLREFIKAGVRP